MHTSYKQEIRSNSASVFLFTSDRAYSVGYSSEPEFECPSVGLDHRGQPSLPTCISEHPMILSPDNHHFFLGTLLTDTDHSPSITIHKSCSCLAITIQPLLNSLKSFIPALLSDTFEDKIVICCSV